MVLATWPIGQGMALLFAFFGLFGPNPLLIFIALFVWLGAAQEASMAQIRSALDGITTQRAQNICIVAAGSQ